MVSDQMIYVKSSKVIVSSRVTHNHHWHLMHGYQPVIMRQVLSSLILFW